MVRLIRSSGRPRPVNGRTKTVEPLVTLARYCVSNLGTLLRVSRRASEEGTHEFEQLGNLPAHPLIIHPAVVFIPLQIAAAVVYGVVPPVRRQIWWAVLGLAVVAPVAAWAAKFSGEAFEQRLLRNGTIGTNFDKITEHASFAASTTWW